MGFGPSASYALVIVVRHAIRYVAENAIRSLRYLMLPSSSFPRPDNQHGNEQEGQDGKRDPLPSDMIFDNV
jgi:hypothetical protein